MHDRVLRVKFWVLMIWCTTNLKEASLTAQWSTLPDWHGLHTPHRSLIISFRVKQNSKALMVRGGELLFLWRWGRMLILWVGDHHQSHVLIQWPQQRSRHQFAKSAICKTDRLMMASFKSSKASWYSVFQMNLIFFFQIMLRAVAFFVNWGINVWKKFTIPMSLAIHLTWCGGGKFLMALVLSGSTDTRWWNNMHQKG
jgi:hypothetical protein